MDNKQLIARAYEAMEQAYAPYSKFKVGAVVVAQDKIYTGCNIENASYSATICAERCAIFKAISDGCRQIDKVVIVCSKHSFAYPCGTCRQVMAEFMKPDGRIVVTDDKEIKEYELSDLLPESFRM